MNEAVTAVQLLPKEPRARWWKLGTPEKRGETTFASSVFNKCFQCDGFALARSPKLTCEIQTLREEKEDAGPTYEHETAAEVAVAPSKTCRSKSSTAA